MPTITFGTNGKKFGGIMPRLNGKKLPEDAAQTAQNVDLLPGRLDPLLDLGSTVDTQTGNTIFKWRRNNSSEWLSMSGIEDYAVGPIKNDQYSRVYYTDEGTLKMHAWKNGAKVSRTVGITKPTDAHIPTVTTAPQDTYIFNPNDTTVTLDARQTLSSAILNDSDAKTKSTIALDRHKYNKDGTISLYFRVSSQVFNLAHASAAQENPDFLRLPAYRLNIGSDTIPTNIGDNLYDAPLELQDGGTTYATFQVVRIEEQGVTIDWNQIWVVAPTDGGTPTAQEANPITSSYIVKITAAMNYVDASGVSRGLQYAHYVQTYVDDLGEESPPSGISEMVAFYPGQKVSLSLGASPGGNITYRRLYRSAAGSEEDAFFFLAELGVGTTTYDDVLADSELQDPLPAFESPPTSLTGIVTMPNGYLVGFEGKTLHFSEPWHPYSWPDKYQQELGYEIVGLAVASNDLVVLTKGRPSIVFGTHPDEVRIEELPFPQACASRRSIAVMNELVVYASPDGVCFIRHGVGSLVSEKYYRRKVWKALTPSSAIAAIQDKKYYIWMTGINLEFDFDEGLSAMTTHDITATALYTDLEDDTLYVSQSGAIKAWEGGSAKTLTWKSKDHQTVRRWAPTCGRIVADSYNATIKLYADGSLVDTTTVTSEDAFRFPILTQAKVWSLEVSNDDGIDEVRISSSMAGLRR